MADGLNRVMLLGNLGADPELRKTSNGESILKLRIATTEGYLDRNRVRQERTEWHSVTVFGRRADALARYLSKGSRIFVEGSLRTSDYETAEGERRRRTEIVARGISFAGGGNKPRSSEHDAAEPEAPDSYGDDGGDDDIPF